LPAFFAYVPVILIDFSAFFQNVSVIPIFTGTLSSASSCFRGKSSKVPAMLSITGTLAICLQLFSWQIFKSAGNAQYYRHFIDMPPVVFVANLQKCRQCSVLPALYRYASSFFRGISPLVPPMLITGIHVSASNFFRWNFLKSAGNAQFFP
jgi:hypothetical protein